MLRGCCPTPTAFGQPMSSSNLSIEDRRLKVGLLNLCIKVQEEEAGMDVTQVGVLVLTRAGQS